MKMRVGTVRRMLKGVSRVVTAPVSWLRRRQSPARQRLMSRLSVIPGPSPAKRGVDEWKRLRKLTVSEVKKNIDEGQPVSAIRKLCRALLEDGQYPPYLDLLRQAAVLRRQRKGVSSKQDPLAGFLGEDRDAAMQLEAFIAYVQEVDTVLSKAGVRSYAPPIAKRDRPPS
jgi:hypothetical protein